MGRRLGGWALSSALVTAACSGTISDPGGDGAPTNGATAGTGNGSGGGGDNAGAASGGGTTGSGGAGSTVFSAFESVARRLSQAELNNVLRDLLGDDTSPASTYLPEDEYAPYDNDYTLQEASQALIDSLDALAEDVASRMVADPATRALLVPCTPTDAGDATCFRTVVDDLLTRAFRRPVSAEEVDPYMGLLAFATEDNAYVDNDFYTAVGLLVQSVIQDPEFLYRIEVGTATETDGVQRLGAYEIASRLSFLLWGSTPDSDLLGAAADDSLSSPEGRRTQAARLLGDDRAHRQLHRFHAMWLGYRAIPHTPELVQAFHQETSALIDRVVFDEDRSYLDLFTLGETYVDDFLAGHYGMPAPSGGIGWVPYDDPGRAGILAHGSVLAAFSKFSDTSPTQRGIFVLNRLMCQTIPKPPATVDVDQPPGDDTALCKYDRYAEHRSTASCAACHSQMDPIGFGLEQYDIAGRLREHDDALPDCLIEGKGELPGYGEFSGPAELGQRLVESGEIDSCAVQQLLSFAIGRPLDADELEVALPERVAAFQDSGYGYRELILSFVENDAFALRREPEVTP